MAILHLYSSTCTRPHTQCCPLHLPPSPLPACLSACQKYFPFNQNDTPRPPPPLSILGRHLGVKMLGHVEILCLTLGKHHVFTIEAKTRSPAQKTAPAGVTFWGLFLHHDLDDQCRGCNVLSCGLDLHFRND